MPGGHLHRALVESGKASNVYGGDQQQRDAGYATFGASLSKDKPLDAARTALIATLEGIAADPITDDEVERARTQLLNDIEMELTNPRELGIALSEFIAIGDWRLFFLHRDRLREVKREDVQRVATQYLKTANRTLGIFVPTAQPDRAEIPPAPDVAALVQDYKGAAAVAAGEVFDPTPANIDARTVVRQAPIGMQLALLPKAGKVRGRSRASPAALMTCLSSTAIRLRRTRPMRCFRPG